jgi:N-acetylglucosamine-6-phosphate deacetylase
VLSLWASRAITPDEVLARVSVRAEAGRIVEFVSDVDPHPDAEKFPDGTLVPGLVDLQVNGGDGAAYDAPDPEERARATHFHLRSGTTSLLATVVSAGLDQLEASLARLAPEVDCSGPVIGLHLEGPFLAEAKAGAHERRFLCDPTPEAVESLIASARGMLRLVTLAPERPGALDAIRCFAEAGAVVAAGHSLASSGELRRAIEHGLSFMTHVGNASDWPSRPFDPEAGFRRSEPGMVGTFLFEPRLRGSLILDGLHLHPELARALVELRGPESVALVSDAAPAAGLPPGHYTWGGLDAVIHPGGYATAGEGLAGSVNPLIQGVRTAVGGAGLALPVAIRLATATPAEIIGVAGRKGRLGPGHDADLLLLGPDLSVRAVYRAGERVKTAPST